MTNEDGMRAPKLLPGIQLTGRFHRGNYFGAIRQYIDLQGSDEAYYFIANLHALTTVREHELTAPIHARRCRIDLLALGLNPERAVLSCAVRCPGGERAVLAADDRPADGFARAAVTPTRT